ncbi:MAG: C39 family peptidase [bacterium]
MRHGLIQHDFSDGDFSCEMDGVRLAGGAVALSGEGAEEKTRTGGLESGAVGLPFPAREMVLTWNSSTPMGAWLDVRFCVGDGGGWSGWYEMGEWGKAGGGPRWSGDARFGKLEVDILRAAVPFDRVRYRIGLGSACADSPALKMVSICFSGEGDEEEGGRAWIGAGGSHDLAVPWLSQFRREVVWDGDMMKAGVCAPTSLAMVLRYYGCGTSVYEVAKMARDEGAGIYGNWAYMVAAAGEFGLRAWVERHSCWEGLLERLRQGIPPILSIAYGKGTFGDFPDRSSEGHLLVLRGWTEDGRLVCNDPGVEEEKLGRGARFSPEELGKAFFGHGGVAVVVGPRRVTD